MIFRKVDDLWQQVQAQKRKTVLLKIQRQAGKAVPLLPEEKQQLLLKEQRTQQDNEPNRNE